MFLRTLTLGCVLSCGLALLAPASGFAQAPSPQAIQRDSQRLRAELDRVNAEIAALKSGGRSVANDYLLRDKLAEAEALARKLTEAEKRARADRTPSPAVLSAPALIPPVATPHDSAVELEAKADLLSDQARRLRVEADALAHAAQQIRARQALRRRAGAWDRDPLAGFENSKRNFAVTNRTGSVSASDSSSSRSKDTGSTTLGAGSGSATTGSNGATKGPVSDGVGPVYGGAGATPPPISLGPGSGAPESATPVITTTPSANHPTLLPLAAPTGLSDSASRAVQQRPLLDPASLASVRNNLSQSGSMSDPEAIEAAALALRNHARALEEQASRIRSGVTR
jgi:hypothetical protein